MTGANYPSLLDRTVFITGGATGIAVVAQADLQLGLGRFGRDLGTEPQLGMTVTAGAEFRLK